MKPIQQILFAVLVAGNGLGALTPVVASAAEPAAATPCASGVPLASDFDGDDLADLVVGARVATGPVATDQELWIQPGDGGAATWLLDTGSLRSADLNGDACADAILFQGDFEPWLKLVPGTPDGLDLANAVEVTLRQAADVSVEEDRTLSFEAAGIRHDGFSQVVVAGCHFWEESEYGNFVDVLTLDASLTVTNTQILAWGQNEDVGVPSSLVASGGTVAVGAPYARVNGHNEAGAVHLYTPDTTDRTQLVQRVVLTQNSRGVPGSAETGDSFGHSLAMRDGRLAIGVPGETIGRIRDAGLVQPIRWNEAKRTYTAYRAISQNTKGVPGSNQKSDAFGTDLALARGLTAKGSFDILIGAFEACGAWGRAGSVTVANFTRARYRGYTQETKGIPGTSESGDCFSHVGVLQNSVGADTVLIGAPGEDSNGTEDVGRAIRSDGAKLTTKTIWTNIAIPPDAPAGLSEWGRPVGADG